MFLFIDFLSLIFYFIFCFFFFTFLDVTTFFLFFFYFLIFQVFILLLIPKKNKQLLRNLSFKMSLFSFFLSLFFFLRLMKVTNSNLYDAFQFLYTFNWSSSLNISYSIGIDGLSIFFLLLTTFLIPICILVS